MLHALACQATTLSQMWCSGMQLLSKISTQVYLIAKVAANISKYYKPPQFSAENGHPLCHTATHHTTYESSNDARKCILQPEDAGECFSCAD